MCLFRGCLIQDRLRLPLKINQSTAHLHHTSYYVPHTFEEGLTIYKLLKASHVCIYDASVDGFSYSKAAHMYIICSLNEGKVSCTETE